METQKMWTAIYPVYKDPKGIKNSENALHEVAQRFQTMDDVTDFLHENLDIDPDEMLVIPPTLEITGADLFTDARTESINEHEKWMELVNALREMGYTPSNVAVKIADSHSSDANYSNRAGDYEYHRERVNELYKLVKRL